MAAIPKSSISSAGDSAPSTNAGKTAIYRASARMASTIAARKREPGEIVMVSSVTAVAVPGKAGGAIGNRTRERYLTNGFTRLGSYSKFTRPSR